MKTGTNILAAMALVGAASLAGAKSEYSNEVETDSKRFDFHWRIPSDWEFVKPDRPKQGLPTAEAAEAVVARTKSRPGAMATLIVSEMVSSESPGDRTDFDDEQYGRAKLGLAGALNLKSEESELQVYPRLG